MHTAPMSFGKRLRAAIKASRFKSNRRFAIEGLGWPPDNGAQRLQNYLDGREPDFETVKSMARALDISPSDLISEGVEDGLRDILLQLLSLGGIDPDKADTIANATLEAKRLLESESGQEDSPLGTRARLAARLAWRAQQRPETGM